MAQIVERRRVKGRKLMVEVDRSTKSRVKSRGRESNTNGRKLEVFRFFIALNNDVFLLIIVCEKLKTRDYFCST